MLARDEADADVIHVCLLGARNLMAAKRSRKARIKWLQTSKSSFATSVLEYIWSCVDIWRALLADDAATWALCYFATAEGLQHLVLDWIAVDIDLSEHVWFEKHGGQWRGRLLRSLVVAQAYNEVDHSLDAALTSFFHVAEIKTAQASIDSTGNLSRLSLFPAVIGLNGLFVTGSWYNTSPQLYEQFKELAPQVLKRKTGPGQEIERDWSAAKLRLYHPSWPDAATAVAHMQLKNQQGVAVPASVLGRKAFKSFMVRARAVAAADNEHEIASWVSQEFQRFFGENIPPPEGCRKIIGRPSKREMSHKTKQTAPQFAHERSQAQFSRGVKAALDLLSTTLKLTVRS